MIRFAFPVLAISFLSATTAHAHKLWLLPSQTVFSSANSWVTVDAAVSNDLFYFDHVPLSLVGLQITDPDGNPVKAQNVSTGNYRNVFDFPVNKRGTYRITRVSTSVFGSYQHGDQRKRWRGPPKEIATKIPKEATDVRLTENLGRIETFVTNGRPTTKSLEPTGKGIEMIPVTHPNQLYAHNTATFRFLVNGQPRKGLVIFLFRGGTRYRKSQDELSLSTDSHGEVRVTWRKPGMYLLETSVEDDQTSVREAQSRRLSYAATLEVLPQ